MRKFIVVICMILLCSIFSGCQSEQIITAPELLEPAGVKSDIVTLQKGSIQQFYVYNGELVPYVEELQFAADGLFKEYKVELGETVQEGQVLAVLDDESIQDAIDAQEEAVAEIKRYGGYTDREFVAEIESLKATLAGMQSSGASQTDCQIQEKKIALMEAKMAQNQELRNLELQQHYNRLNKLYAQTEELTIVAPFSGKVVYRSELNKGSGVRKDTPVICIADEEQMFVSVEQINSSILQQAIETYAVIEGKEYPVIYKPYDSSDYLSMSLSGGKIDTRFVLAEPSNAVQYGQFAQIMVVVKRNDNAHILPKNAVYQDGATRYVYKETEDGRVRCDVEIGIYNSVEIEILSGLQEGDAVYVQE